MLKPELEKSIPVNEISFFQNSLNVQQVPDEDRGHDS